MLAPILCAGNLVVAVVSHQQPQCGNATLPYVTRGALVPSLSFKCQLNSALVQEGCST